MELNEDSRVMNTLGEIHMAMLQSSRPKFGSRQDVRDIARPETANISDQFARELLSEIPGRKAEEFGLDSNLKVSGRIPEAGTIIAVGLTHGLNKLRLCENPRDGESFGSTSTFMWKKNDRGSLILSQEFVPREDGISASCFHATTYVEEPNGDLNMLSSGVYTFFDEEGREFSKFQGDLPLNELMGSGETYCTPPLIKPVHGRNVVTYEAKCNDGRLTLAEKRLFMPRSGKVKQNASVKFNELPLVLNPEGLREFLRRKLSVVL